MSTLNAFFGQYGGQYVPAELIPALNHGSVQLPWQLLKFPTCY